MWATGLDIYLLIRIRLGMQFVRASLSTHVLRIEQYAVMVQDIITIDPPQKIIFKRLYACMNGCMYTCICVYVCMHVCMLKCMYVCMYVCVNVCVFIVTPHPCRSTYKLPLTLKQRISHINKHRQKRIDAVGKHATPYVVVTLTNNGDKKIAYKIKQNKDARTRYRIKPTNGIIQDTQEVKCACAQK